MTVKWQKNHGEMCWVIDRVLQRPGHPPERLRKRARIQTKAAAEQEEQELITRWQLTGSAKFTYEKAPVPEPEPLPVKAYTWEDAVQYHQEHVAPALKPSTRRGYKIILDGPHMKVWAGNPLKEITGARIRAWDTKLSGMLFPSTRRNHQIVLRSVFRAVGPIDGEPGVMIQTLPAFPRLPSVGRTTAQAIREDDLDILLSSPRGKGCSLCDHEAQVLAFALAAEAGLRAGETRALQVMDVDFETRLITIRRAMSDEELSTPKADHFRQTIITDRLFGMLQDRIVMEGLAPEDLVCLTGDGKLWTRQALTVAFARVAKRLGIEGVTYHSLRHRFSTHAFRRGVDAPTVQALLGHANLATTQRYSHTDSARIQNARQLIQGDL